MRATTMASLIRQNIDAAQKGCAEQRVPVSAKVERGAVLLAAKGKLLEKPLSDT